MIAVDTNVLARFYCEDPGDPEAARQRPIAKKVLLESASVFVPLTVVLELEWVMRGFYGASPSDVAAVLEHLLGMEHVTVERWESIKDALDVHRNGLEFSDALHWATSRHCQEFVSFDDRRFVRRANRMGLSPEVRVAR